MLLILNTLSKNTINTKDEKVIKDYQEPILTIMQKNCQSRLFCVAIPPSPAAPSTPD